MMLTTLLKITILMVCWCVVYSESSYNGGSRLKPRLARRSGLIRKDYEKRTLPETTIILQRADGSETFNRRWADYRLGFGKPQGEYWLGLSKIHELTTQRRYKLRVDLTDWSGETKWAAYSEFSVASEADMYKLTVAGYDASSSAGDSLSPHNGALFSTPDKDNDKWSGNCARQWRAGWWYTSCYFTSPTGQYTGSEDSEITWFYAYNDYRGFKAVTFTIIPVLDTVFLRRMDGSENFYRSWADYRAGFGKPDGEFWLGLETIHKMTSTRKYKLHLDVTSTSGNKLWAAYSQFSVASEAEKYKLTVTGYDTSSTFEDKMNFFNGMKFSTRDQDNDRWFLFNCAQTYKGAWWYKDCYPSGLNPTGVYKTVHFQLKGITLTLQPVDN